MTPSSVDAGSLVGERLGKYHLLALIAIGGTAEIYLARIAGEAGFEKYVVVKCLLDHLADDVDFVRMFLDEARLCAQLDHSNIVQTLELGQHEGRYFMVMEHLAGMSLAQLARKTHERTQEQVIPTRMVLGLAAQACGGLHYAHQRTGSDGKNLGVVHRDVSPQNLVVTFEGMLKLVDFGIAKANLRQTHTRSGTIKGKFAYMSPEQCLAEPIDRRTDVFALGTVVHELLTARRLFKRASTYETYQAILKGSAPPPSRYNQTVDDELDQVVLRALAYHRDDRYESTEAFGEAMLGWLHSRGQSVSASDVSRYVEKVCGPEIEDHSAHMRELISGHQPSTSETLRWDSAADEDKQEPLAVIGSASPVSIDPSLGSQPGSIELDLPSDDFGMDDSSRLDAAPQQLLRPRGQHREDDFAGDTQIELDPMERVAALEAEAAAIEAAERDEERARGAAHAPARGREPGGRLVGAGAGSARGADPGSSATRLPAAGRGPGSDPDSAGPTRAIDVPGPGAVRGGRSGPGEGSIRASDPDSAGPTRALGLAESAAVARLAATEGKGGARSPDAGSAAARLPGGPPGGAVGHYPSASLRPGGGQRGGPGGAAPAEHAPGERRQPNEQTAPEVVLGGGGGGKAEPDQMTLPVSDMIRPSDVAGGRTNPIGVYETPLPRPGGHPGGHPGAQMWGDDSAEVLRHARRPAVGPPVPTPPTEHAPGPLPMARPTLHRPPPGHSPMPGPAPAPLTSVGTPIWLLAVAFVLSAGVGLGLTVLIGSLLA
jgi:serine/threonine protein kinase